MTLCSATPADGIPLITQPLIDATINEGEPLKLSCRIEGLQVTVTWFHNSKVEAFYREMSCWYLCFR